MLIALKMRYGTYKYYILLELAVEVITLKVTGKVGSKYIGNNCKAKCYKNINYHQS